MILATIVGNNASVPMGFVKSLIACREYEHLFSYGLYVDDNRNAIWDIMKNRNDDFLFIDSDMTFTPMDVWKISEHLKDKDIVSGLYYMGDRKPACFRYILQPRQTDLLLWEQTNILEVYYPTDFEEIDACGAGFLGISRRVVKALDKPFTRFINPVSGRLYGEDMAFCVKAKEAGFNLWIDPEIKLGHIKTQIL
jgi:GT2 family glycosyltransferase